MTDKSKLLVGCGEPSVVAAISVLLAESCEVAERSSFAELLNEARSCGYAAVIVYGNCLTPPCVCDGGLLENTSFAIQKIKAAQMLPVIALTSMPEWRETLRAAGAGFCLATPFDLADFRQAVDDCLQRRA